MRTKGLWLRQLSTSFLQVNLGFAFLYFRGMCSKFPLQIHANVKKEKKNPADVFPSAWEQMVMFLKCRQSCTETEDFWLEPTAKLAHHYLETIVRQSDHFLKVLLPSVGNIIEWSVMFGSAEFQGVSGISKASVYLENYIPSLKHSLFWISCLVKISIILGMGWGAWGKG